MTDPIEREQSWSFVTLLRIRPILKRPGRGVIQYRITDGKSDEYAQTFKVLELEIPEGADPGLVHNNKSGFIRFTFNDVFDEDSSQEDIFERIQSMVLDIFEGVNSTVFAYGQTGSGKTYSMCGGESYQERGLIPRTLGLVFEELHYREQNDQKSFKCLISFTEVFGEAVYDLLDADKQYQPLEEWSRVQIFETEDGLTLRNINVFEVTSEEEALNLFFMGTVNRSTSSTPMNHASSRSHAIFTIVMEGEGIRADKTTLTIGKINLVDLAGSERLYKSDNNKAMMKEGRSINLSLHYLEQVIVCLRDQARRQAPSSTKIKSSHVSAGALNGFSRSTSRPPPISLPVSHIPYRNSVLTSILRDSLGGNCKSCFLLTLTVESEYFEESISTARFGQRCGEIQVKVHANLEIDIRSQLNEALRRVSQLESQLSQLTDEKSALMKSLHDTEDVITELTSEDTRPLTETELILSARIATRISTLSRSSECEEDSVRVTVAEETKGLRKPVVVDISIRVAQILYLSQRDARAVAVEVESHRKLFQQQQTESVGSKEDNGDDLDLDLPSPLNPHGEETGPTTHLAIAPHPLPQSPESVDSAADSKANFFNREGSLKSVVSRKLKALQEGVTILSHGSFGSTKVKMLVLSSDGKMLSWREMKARDETAKSVTIAECGDFRVSDERGKSGGIIVVFTDGNRKKHEFEFPLTAQMSEQDNVAKIRKYVELLNELKAGKKHLMLEQVRGGEFKHQLSSQMRATQLSEDVSHQISSSSLATSHYNVSAK